MEWLKLKEFEYAIWAIAFSLIGTLLAPGARTFKAWVVAVIGAAPIGWIAGLISVEYGLSNGWTTFIASVSGLLGLHIILGIIGIGEWFSEHAGELFGKIVNILIERFKKK